MTYKTHVNFYVNKGTITHKPSIVNFVKLTNTTSSVDTEMTKRQMTYTNDLSL